MTMCGILPHVVQMPYVLPMTTATHTPATIGEWTTSLNDAYLSGGITEAAWREGLDLIAQAMLAAGIDWDAL